MNIQDLFEKLEPSALRSIEVIENHTKWIRENPFNKAEVKSRKEIIKQEEERLDMIELLIRFQNVAMN